MGESTSYDVAVPTGTTLSGSPHLALYTVVVGHGNGNATGHLLASLLDCATATDCTALATGDLRVNEHLTTDPQLDETDLSAVTAVIAPGHLLRLTLELGTAGNATAVTLFQDAAGTPSRLDVTAAPPPGVAVAALGLAGALLVLLAVALTRVRALTAGR